MLDEHDNLKLCDFGISAGFDGDDDLVKGTIGTMRYYAPEQVRTGVKKVISGR
jgi:serine/threonine protein kinase